MSLCGYSTQNVTDCKGVARREATSSAALKVQGVKPTLKTQLRRELKHYAAVGRGPIQLAVGAERLFSAALKPSPLKARVHDFAVFPQPPANDILL